MNIENLSTLKIHKLSNEQYKRELENGNIDENAIYLTPNEEIDLSSYVTAEHVNDNFETKVEAIEKLTEAKTYTDIVASGKSDSNHNHDSDYDVIGSASESLILAKSYTDSKVANLTSTTVVDNKISSHNTSTSAHNDIRELIFDLTTKLNNFLDVDETTTDQLSEVLTLIENNKGTLESLTITKINVSDIINNLTTNSTSKVLSAAQGVAIKALIDVLQEELDSHTHTISDVSGLQSALDDKAASSHGIHVTYSTTDPVMDGTASTGSASTVARSDHKHPTDTSRASKTEFDTHVNDTTKHITSTERTDWNAAKTHADSAHNYLPLTGGTLSGNTTINNAGARYRITNGTNTTWFGMNSTGSTIGIYNETNKKYLIQHDGTNTRLNGDCTGNAGSATKAYTTATNSSTYKSYQIPFVSGGTSGNSDLLKNNGIKFDVRDGTTSQNGVALLLLGDTTVSGTDGNKSGGLYMYNSKGKYAAMIPAENTGNITITLPSATGTLATTADINALRDEFANGSW